MLLRWRGYPNIRRVSREGSHSESEQETRDHIHDQDDSEAIPECQPITTPTMLVFTVVTLCPRTLVAFLGGLLSPLLESLAPNLFSPSYQRTKDAADHRSTQWWSKKYTELSRPSIGDMCYLSHQRGELNPLLGNQIDFDPRERTLAGRLSTSPLLLDLRSEALFGHFEDEIKLKTKFKMMERWGEEDAENQQAGEADGGDGILEVAKSLADSGRQSCPLTKHRDSGILKDSEQACRKNSAKSTSKSGLVSAEEGSTIVEGQLESIGETGKCDFNGQQNYLKMTNVGMCLTDMIMNM
ncbi:uncharacterized protein BDR25DRAFT_358585 [Lindgomyces ingoldianus]|uniref:Uncharacterized protein n=1 Tax=Lindgomyces ingoldianus TaxID=673940 RepID=A0ACB6QMC6_9PLEO|nr:uncharacterized protein BDR25DRAFT_358585 [Lindgomyces ingoldianus]KAF2467472.1 hypothetical protein BDR25DRAFT_358585 [Lindgomyces ingoldianus]